MSWNTGGADIETEDHHFCRSCPPRPSSSSQTNSFVLPNKMVTKTKGKFFDYFTSGWPNSSTTDCADQDHPFPTPSSQMKNVATTFATEKRVTFNEQVHIYFTISLNDISPTEHKATWYSKAEYKEINRSSCRQIKNLDRGKLFKDKKYCSRGLESHTRMASLTKRKNYELSHRVVFDEQARQHREGVHEVEYLAYLYHSVTSSCQLWANVVGLSDQRAAEETQLDDDVCVLLLSAHEERHQLRLMSTPSTTSPRKIRAMHSATRRLRIRNIELARAA